MKQSLRQPDGNKRVLMLLSNCFEPDPRVEAEARALLDAGCHVTVLGWDRDRKCPIKEMVGGLEVERITTQSTHGRGSTQAVVLLLVQLQMIVRGLRKDFDVVHAHDFDTLIAGYFLSRLKRKPLVYDSHEDYAAMLHSNIPRFMETLIRRIESCLVRRVDLLITVGEILRQEFESRGARRSIVVGNWKNLSQFRLGPEVRAAVRSELGIPSDVLVVGFIANLGRERHIPEFISAIVKRPNVHLLIGGTGPMAELVESASRQSSNIHYLGFVPPTLIGQYTSAVDVVFYGFDLCNPNARFSAPNKLFEALAAGRALITGTFGEIGKIVKEVGCGVVLGEFSEAAICRALDLCSNQGSLELWKERAGRAGQQTYNWANAEVTLLRAYRQLCSPGIGSALLTKGDQKEAIVP